MFYSLLISSVSSVLETANIASRKFEEKLIELDDYMRSKRLPSTLREKVKDYFHLIHSKGKFYNENEIHSMLTPILSRQIKVCTGKELSVKVPLLSAIKNRGFAEEISTMIEPMIVFENEEILREKTIGNEMFFISSGIVEIFVTSNNNALSYIAIGDGCVSGKFFYDTFSTRFLIGVNTACLVLRRGISFIRNAAYSISENEDTMHAVQVVQSTIYGGVKCLS